MKKIIQLDPNTKPTTSQKIASALNGLVGTIFEARSSYTEKATLKFFDRFRNIWVQTTSTAQIGVADWTEIAKGDGFIFKNTSGTTQNFYVNNLDPNKFTVSCVFLASASGVRNVVMYDSAITTPTESDYLPRIQVSSGNSFALYKGTATVRISAPIDNIADVNILTLTFSTQEGLKIFINGILKSSNAADKTPLTNAVARFVTSINNGWGHLITVNDDLSKIENAGRLKIIHDALKQHYAI